ncbi:hypothetical protein GGQ80_003106 [Sphingomonas jinjuensis]|uniref:Nucleotidyltransferase domain-containing protein n=1 Tax=Sphingomonas jinjuensis TaxID=535907 RepID=A0A840FMN9_9SPHN|nr:hypothetical protein [Sphingomonas jinjuensis]MBB4155188.1 hypothetical protein [Sphingomonas jinjuensis]
MTGAMKPWWVIGSAAVALHGAPTDVGDVDILIDIEDVPRVFDALDIPVEAGRPDARFRSDVFSRWDAAPLPVELMAGLCLRDRSEWVPVSIGSRIGLGGVYVPTRAELIDLLHRFGRAKDLDRAEALGATS